MTAAAYLRCLVGIVRREALRFLHQRGRFFVGAGAAAGLAGRSSPPASASCSACRSCPPYETYVLYEVYIVPGLVAMVLLFNGMQSSLSMVYDREMGSMRVLLTSPLPRWWLLLCKLLAGVLVACAQVYVFLAHRLVLGRASRRRSAICRAAGAGARGV